MRLLAGVVLLSGAVLGQAPDLFDPIDGAEYQGRLLRITADQTVEAQLLDGRTVSAPLELMQEIELGGAEPAAPGKRPDTLWLRSGLALPAELVQSSERAGVFRLPFAAALVEMPWRYVRAVRLEGGVPAHAGFLERVATPPDGVDLLYARREQGEVVRVSVRFDGVSDDLVRVHFNGADQTIPLARVHGLVFGNDRGAAPDRRGQPRVRLALRSGRELSGSLAKLDAEVCMLSLDEGQTISLRRPMVARISVESDRLVHLTDLEAKIEQTAALDRVWPPMIDRGPGGGVIRMAGKAYARGVVMFPRTSMTYSLGGRFDVFEASAGFEERAGAAANAVFRVRADGKVVFDSGAVTPGAAPRSLTLPVTGVQALTLEVDFGEALDLGDVCVFAAPRLLIK